VYYIVGGPRVYNVYVWGPLDRSALQRKKGARAVKTCEWILETDQLKPWLDGNVAPDGSVEPVGQPEQPDIL
jgi:hypothetical protein